MIEIISYFFPEDKKSQIFYSIYLSFLLLLSVYSLSLPTMAEKGNLVGFIFVIELFAVVLFSFGGLMEYIPKEELVSWFLPIIISGALFWLYGFGLIFLVIYSVPLTIVVVRIIYGAIDWSQF